MQRIMFSSLLAIVLPAVALAQTPADYKQEFMAQFEASMEKFIALAEAMPADKFTWSPGPGVMQVGQVYVHVANYNYGYPSNNMGVPKPQGIDLSTIEQVRDKASVIKALKESAAYVRTNVQKMDRSEEHTS